MKKEKFIAEKESASEMVPEYSYYSKVLGKAFDTLKELKAAEDEAEKAEIEKKKASDLKRQEAKSIENAYNHLKTVKSKSTELVSAAGKHYSETISEARNTYKLAVDAAEKEVREAEKAYQDALKEFISKHPEGYHMTFKDGDSTTRIDANFDIDTSIFDRMASMMFWPFF